MTSSTTSKSIRLSTRNLVALGSVGVLFSWVVLCFCSFLPFVLFLSLLFNSLFLGASLFSALAQEREKRTIDALRLTQLSALDILLYKSYRELKMWGWGNGAFLFLSGLGAAWSGSPLLWALLGALSLASGGLLSIALALAVSTRSETTSSAVVSGWVSKGVWLVGLPLLDYVLEAVLVLGRDFHLLSYLDPAWVYKTVLNALIFETGNVTLLWLALGAVASVVGAYLLLLQSSRLIDSSFESAATLEDRERHSVYGKRFAFGLQKNPFLVRELAWQVRTGAGAWPGYAVFLTLFLAPFLYGLAQQTKKYEQRPVKIVRQSVTAQSLPVFKNSSSTPQVHGHSSAVVTGCDEPLLRYHSHFCLSRLMGLPVPTERPYRNSSVSLDQGERLVVNSRGQVDRVSASNLERLQRPSLHSPKSRDRFQRSRVQTELDRGLMTGLALALLYLFIRGAAFMSGAVTGERERRAWDQIALTGASPESYLSGKLLGVLYYPLKQLLLSSPVLLLFAVFGGVPVGNLLLAVPLLLVSFLAAANIGLLASTTQPSSHQAQGRALLAGATVLLAPLFSWGWMLAGLLVFALLGGTSLKAGERYIASVSAALWIAIWGSAASPLAGVMRVCSYDGLGPIRLSTSALPTWVSVMVGMVTMALLAWGAFRLASRTLNQGGSLRA